MFHCLRSPKHFPYFLNKYYFKAIFRQKYRICFNAKPKSRQYFTLYKQVLGMQIYWSRRPLQTAIEAKVRQAKKCTYGDKRALHTHAPSYINRNWDLIRVTSRYFRPETAGRVVYSCVSHQRGPMSVDNRKLHVASALLTSPPPFILLFLIYHPPSHRVAFIVTSPRHLLQRLPESRV